MADRNTPLKDRVRAAIGHELSEIGEEAFEAFFDLPGVEDWNPENLYLREISTVFDFGLPFALIGDTPSANELREKIGGSISGSREATKGDWGEILAGALMRHFQANIEFIKREKNKRTPDLSAEWSSESVLDIEVTAAETLEIHQKVQTGLADLSEVIRASDRDWNIIAYIRDASDHSFLNEVLDAVVQLSPGEFAEDHDKWMVRALEPDQREEVVGGKIEELFAPAWWPASEPSFFASSTVIGGQHSPVVRLGSLIPDVSYINPIRRKAERPQRDSSKPYLIAVDVMEFMGAHQRVRKQLSDWLPLWDVVSGIMLFDARFWIGSRKKEWRVSILRNPHAKLPLPNELLDLPDGEEFPVEFELSKS